MQEEKQEKPRWIGGVEPPSILLNATGTEVLEYECREQPRLLHDLIHAYKGDPEIRSQLQALRQLLRKSGPVLFLGMGASFCASFGGSVLLQSHGRMSFSVDAGEWLHYAQSTWKQAALSVLLTASGESAELVELFKIGKEQPLGLICNNTSSTCWTLADNRLPVLAGPEYGNATKTYTNTAAASIILASEILGLPWQQQAERVLETYAGTLDRLFSQRNELETFCRGAANIEIIGRGAAYGSAVMSALCIREMSGFRAAGHTGAGFKHGPNLDVDNTHVAIIYAVGRAAELGFKLSDECLRRGGKVVLVSSEDGQRTENLLPVYLEAVPEPWEGITTQLVAQALTLAWIERNGCRLPPRFQYGKMEQ
ncbi:SIS domain-containing protein [Terracidiphilus gabretensis]|uniref:SIS domain-containing protein n=1 Tax=Terracidiphilus gabretensis TaxID=1577687 RepID=UPI00071B7719|nr:SIS domain-containing protein [Terracidiphilus gabretensis]